MKRPWNIVDLPVYSLATYNDEQVNMNVCTYVSAISMKPKLFMIAVDYQTKTFENLNKTNQSVLQILHQDHAPLINLLGKKSGKQINKMDKLNQKGMLDSWLEHHVIRDACGYLLLDKKNKFNANGDHELFVFEVKKSSTKNESGILMFQELIDKGIIL